MNMFNHKFRNICLTSYKQKNVTASTQQEIAHTIIKINNKKYNYRVFRKVSRCDPQ